MFVYQSLNPYNTLYISKNDILFPYTLQIFEDV